MDDIKDVKPPVALPVEVADYKWWMVALVAAAVVALVVFFVVRCNRRRKSGSPSMPAIPPWEIARRQLEELALKQYAQKRMFKVFYTNLSDIARHYLENRFNIRAAEMTTEEFLNFANTSAVLQPSHKSILQDFLSGCDMVKFAKHEPSVNDAQTHFDLIVKLVNETKPPEPAA